MIPLVGGGYHPKAGLGVRVEGLVASRPAAKRERIRLLMASVLHGSEDPALAIKNQRSSWRSGLACPRQGLRARSPVRPTKFDGFDGFASLRQSKKRPIPKLKRTADFRHVPPSKPGPKWPDGRFKFDLQVGSELSGEDIFSMLGESCSEENPLPKCWVNVGEFGIGDPECG